MIENGLEGQKFLVVCLFWGGCHHPNFGTHPTECGQVLLVQMSRAPAELSSFAGLLRCIFSPLRRIRFPLERV